MSYRDDRISGYNVAAAPGSLAGHHTTQNNYYININISLDGREYIVVGGKDGKKFLQHRGRGSSPIVSLLQTIREIFTPNGSGRDSSPLLSELPKYLGSDTNNNEIVLLEKEQSNEGLR